ncbi:hypothetical protein OA333_00375 [Candidatus Pelagibacter sp.]|nr:hypothetical protein [Candidatus Pelagibacter sp.]
MRKKILITSLVIFLIILFSIAYLSFYGIKTDNFNNFINSKVKEYNSRLTLKLVDVFIKLNLSQGSININTKDTFLITENDSLEISNLDININILKFFKKENSIKNIKIESAENSIKDVTSLLNSIDYDLSRYVFYSQVKKGLVKFKLDAEFHIHKQNVYSYQVSGFVKDAKINLVGNGSLDNINFNFDKNDKLTKISNLNFSYQNLNLLSKTIEIKNEVSGAYIIDGDIKTDKALISPNLLFSLANIKQNYLSDKNISLDSKNIFSFKFNKNKKIKNIKISSVINFDEVYLNKKYQNLIFLKQGRINSKYENEQLNAELISNFGFSDNLKLNTDFKKNNLKLSLKSKNNQKIYIKGKLSHEKTLLDPKIFLNLFQLDPNLLSNENINVETDNQFEFEVYNNKLKNYLVNSEINIEKLEFNKQIQDLLYLKNIKTKLTFGEKLLNLNLNSNYSFLDKSFNNESDKNIFNLKLNKNDTKFSDLEIFLKADNNKINTKEIKKYLNLKDKNNLIEDQIINIDSNFIINASVDNLLNIKKFAIRSDLNFDNFNINYKSSLVKKYLKNFNNKFVIKNSNILFDYSNDLANLQLDGKYSLNDQEDSIFLKFTGNKNTFELYSLLNLDNSILNIGEIQYYKKKNIPSKLEILIKKSKKFSNLEKLILTDRTNYISLKNLNISDKFKMTSVDEIDVNFYNKNKILNNFKIKKNSNNYQFTGRQIDGEKLVDRLLKGNSKNKISNFFDNMTTTILFKLNKIYLEKNSYLEKFAGKVDIKNNKLSSAKFDAILDKNNEFSYSHRTTLKNEKITNIFIKEPKSFINNYKFIKGFEEGELKLNSTKIDNVSRSNLRINNFKVKEVPVLAKILTLASLQGIADLLTGEGIRFNKFEMDFKTKNNLIEIDEMYAIGPAISIIMEGYIEKDRITSLRGTLVPATTINKTIAKIPLLGNILVGGKTGEGVFGVSFKIKGPPSDLKSTVNPIKTLTPRFITRTLENLKGS